MAIYFKTDSPQERRRHTDKEIIACNSIFLSLLLLVFWIRTNYSYDSFAFHYPTLTANRFYRCSDFHFCTPSYFPVL